MTMCAQTTVVRTLEDIIRRFAPKHRAETPLTSQTRLVDDAGIDSPRMIDIVLEIEDRLGLAIDDNEVQEVTTFGDLVRLIESHAEGAK
jgi:acyl carrier protein